ncbi:uncharacterized protein LOC110181993 [Drosophila serrata]|uniref:uncharacterized protein LOC110181993 n=1 Tax=Drosophila serrata TaxID=7274 RepID=UPI000A1D2D22|nr:uncharacterized protein LOC110181993 [Drosophila serrata]
MFRYFYIENVQQRRSVTISAAAALAQADRGHPPGAALHWTNCYNVTPEPPQQRLITRTISVPQLTGLPYQGRDAAVYASHGKLVTTNSPLPHVLPLGNITSSGSNLEHGNSPTDITTVTLLTAAIERDPEGGPLRRAEDPAGAAGPQALERLRKINRQKTLKVSLEKLQLSTDSDDSGIAAFSQSNKHLQSKQQ